MIKISKRLNQVLLRVKPQKPLWDIGCDHGYLGIAALQSQATDFVHFVDPAPGSIQKLQNNLKKYQITQNHQIHFAGGQSLPWKQVSGTVVILGMGYRTLMKIWQALESPKDLRFLLSPHSEEEKALEYFKKYNPEISWIEENGRPRLLLEINLPA